MMAGINPFKEHTARGDGEAFEETAMRIFKGAKMVGDIATMNQALISGEIDLHLTGGTYSVSPARADGYPNLRAMTPLKGPIDGKGGVSWIEITSTVNNPEPVAARHRVPEVCAGRRTVAHTVAFAEGTFNPVSQMGNPKCFELFTTEELDAIQWDSLDEEMNRSAEYDIVPDYDKALDLMTAAKRLRG